MTEPTRAFASTADLGPKTVSFDRLGDGLYAYTAEGDPNSGIIVGDDGCMVIDAQATPAMAADVIARVRAVTDKPIRYVLLSHYHAVRVLGASAYEGATIIASDATRGLIVERGEQDKASEIGRFPRLFPGAESIPPGLTWPHVTFGTEMTVWLGRREVKLMHLGRATPPATPWRGCRIPASPSPATSSSTTRPAIAATPISGIGPRPSPRSRR